jgi:hypothetical protein
VTASNTDGKTSDKSDATGVVGSANGPSNTVQPSVSGTAAVGETLTVSNGSWSATATYARQWQRCDSSGANCLNIDGATGQAYGVRTIDVGNRLRALVTAHSTGGQTTVASGTSDVVQSSTTTTTTTVTLPAQGAPKLTFVSLKRVHWNIYARFRVCSQTAGMVRLTEHDYMTRALPYTRHLATRVAVCGSFSKKWVLLPRYRHYGRRYVATLRARDPKGSLSRLVSRSLIVH